MKELELKAVLDDWTARRAAVERAGARLTFEGRLEDRRYDDAQGSLAARDHVLRLRTYRGDADGHAELGWKGPTRYEGGYKVREELAAPTADADALADILGRLGYEVSVAIDREIAQFELGGAVIRFERYPRMDDLVEVEGAPDAIERAVAALGIPRDAFTSERLLAFVRRYEARTGAVAAVSDAELAARRDSHRPGELR